MSIEEDVKQPVVPAYVELFDIDCSNIPGIGVIYRLTPNTNGSSAVLFGGDTYVPAFSAVLGSEPVFKAFADSTFGIKYRLVNPEPDHWPVFRDKLYTLWNSECYLPVSPEFCLEPLESINAPTLVLVGKQEIIRFDHTQAIAAAIPDATLNVVLLAGHFLPETRPFTTAYKIKRFIE